MSLSSSSQATLAQTVCFSVCEAIVRFSERVQPVTAKFASKKPSHGIPTVPPQKLSEPLSSDIERFSQASQYLEAAKRTSRERGKQLKTRENEARSQLYERVKGYDGPTRVQLAKPAPIPSTVRSNVGERDESKEEESEEDESQDDASQDDASVEEEATMIDDTHSVRSSQKFIVGTKPVKKVDRSTPPVSQVKLRGVVLGACHRVLGEMGHNPDEPARSAKVKEVLGAVEFWERVLLLVKSGLHKMEDARKVEQLVVFIKEERRKQPAIKPDTFLMEILNRAGALKK